MGGGVTFYFVEGQCEEVIVRALMTSLKPGTSVVFIFDTDAGNPALVK